MNQDHKNLPTQKGGAFLLSVFAEREKAVQEQALQSGHASRDRSGKITIERKPGKRLEIPVKGKLDAIALFLSDKKSFKWPDSSAKRQELRLALVGWLLHDEHMPESVVHATMLAATGGHNSIPNMVRSTSMKVSEGKRISGWTAVQQILDEPQWKALGGHFLVDMEPWLEERTQAKASAKAAQKPAIESEPESEPDASIVDDAASSETAHEDEPTPPTPEDDEPQPTDHEDKEQVAAPGQPDPAAESRQSGHEHEHGAGCSHDHAHEPAPQPPPPKPPLTIGFKAPRPEEFPPPIPLRSTSGPPEPAPDGAYPCSPQSLALADIAEAARRNELWESSRDGGLKRTKAELLRITAKLPDKKHRGAVEVLIGHQLGLALIGPKTAVETLRGTPYMGAAKFGRHGTIQAITGWRRGKTVAPKLMRWDILRQWGVHHRDIQRLLNAFARDLLEQGAPTSTRRNAMLDQPWRDAERAFLNDVCEMFKKDKRASAKALYEAARCMLYATRRKCADHGDRGYYYLRCKREVACPCCRSIFYEFIHEWIVEQKRWPDEMLMVRLTPVAGPVVVSDHETTELKDADQAGEKKKPGIVMHPSGSYKGIVAPKAEAQKEPEKPQKSMWDMGTEERAAERERLKAEKKAKSKRKKTKRKKTGSHLSDLFMDRLRAAFKLDPGMKELIGRAKKMIALRAYAGVRDALMFLPAFYVDETGEERLTADYLSAIGAFQTPEYQLRRVTRQEAAALILEQREEVARQFDTALLDATKQASEAYLAAGEEHGYESPEAERAYRAVVRDLGEKLLNMEHLKPGAMRPIKKTRRAEVDMPWFSDEDQKRMMMQKLKDEGKDRDHCDYLVKKHEGDLGHKCGKLLETAVEIVETEEILLKNRNGYTPSREEVYDAAEKAGRKPGRRVEPPERVLSAAS